MPFTKEAIYALLSKNDMAVVRGLEAIYARQTADEQSAQTTNHSNGRGFNGYDAKFGSALAIRIQEWCAADPATRYPFPLSTRPGGQLDCGRRLILKYSAQLADIANAKVDVKAVAQSVGVVLAVEELTAERAEFQAVEELTAERAAIQAVEAEDEIDEECDFGPALIEVEDEYLDLV